MSEPFIGQITEFGFNFAPRGWAKCDGAILPIAQNTALFSLLGTTFGGDGRTTFGLPDLRGRDSVHFGTGPGLPPVTWGQKDGTHGYTVTIAHMPAHTHTRGGNTAGGDDSNPTNRYPASSADTGEDLYSNATNTAMGALGMTGGGQALNIVEPRLGILHCIALVGIFPSRN